MRICFALFLLSNCYIHVYEVLWYMYREKGMQQRPKKTTQHRDAIAVTGTVMAVMNYHYG